MLTSNLLYWRRQLQDLIEDAGRISGGWNGKDKKFIVEGTIYDEDDACWADEIVFRANLVLELL
ncbi:MAG: hypothetical protein KKF62_19370 [Bacteroidetes bacterium]|nr:hypothetical protein [Bacteroidota bacterium]